MLLWKSLPVSDLYEMGSGLHVDMTYWLYWPSCHHQTDYFL